MPVETIRIDNRFHGPPKSGNGGYVCGLTARHLAGATAVRLKAPPPLETDLQLESTPAEARLMDDGRLIAEARLTGLDLPTPVAPSYEAAVRASRSFLGFSYHLFPSCFVCGPQRSAGDGLCIFPGPVADASILAAPWVPDATLAGPSGSVRREFLWSALDCPGAFTAMPLPEGVGIVLGELCASVEREVSPGDACVVCAWPIETNGKKRIVGSAIYTKTGELIAKARGTWIEIPIHQWQ